MKPKKDPCPSLLDTHIRAILEPSRPPGDMRQQLGEGAGVGGDRYWETSSYLGSGQLVEEGAANFTGAATGKGQLLGE